MAGLLRVPRSRGAMSGVLLVLLGLWGGLIPMIGPYIQYAFTPDRPWTWTIGRFWLEVLPAIATVIGGITVTVSRWRPTAVMGASLAAAGGAWFAFGSALAPLWSGSRPAQGFAIGSPLARAVEQVGFFTGLGVAIVGIASIALGRLAVISARDMRSAASSRTTDRSSDRVASDGVTTDRAAPAGVSGTAPDWNPADRAGAARAAGPRVAVVRGSTDKPAWRLAGRIASSRRPSRGSSTSSRSAGDRARSDESLVD